MPNWIDGVAEDAHAIAISMLQEKGRSAVLIGTARVDTALEALLKAAMGPPSSLETFFQTDRPIGSLGAKLALARRLSLIDDAVERALNVLRKLRNALAHSAESASLGDPAHSSRFAEVYIDARTKPLWKPLVTTVAAQPPSAHGPLDPVLRDYILLITILVAFLEAPAQQLSPIQPTVVMGFGGDVRTFDEQ